MKQHPNFYENLKEALMRLRGTIVLYDGLPYYVLAIANHKPDGIFRIYLDPIGRDPEKQRHYPQIDGFPADHNQVGPVMDAFIDAHPEEGILRKQMNSPHFNRFRPFPLGMCNFGTGAYYIERQPTRRVEQGLTRQGLIDTPITARKNDQPRGGRSLTCDIFSPAFRACVIGDHPTPEVCLQNLLDPGIENEAVAFHREFAFVRGPIDMIFLAYKADVVGVLQKNDFDYLRLGREFAHTREVIEQLNLFKCII